MPTDERTLTILGFKMLETHSEHFSSAFTYQTGQGIIETASLAWEARLSKEELVEVTDKVRDASRSEKEQARVAANFYMQYGIGWNDSHGKIPICAVYAATGFIKI